MTQIRPHNCLISSCIINEFEKGLKLICKSIFFYKHYSKLEAQSNISKNYCVLVHRKQTPHD